MADMSEKFVKNFDINQSNVSHSWTLYQERGSEREELLVQSETAADG